MKFSARPFKYFALQNFCRARIYIFFTLVVLFSVFFLLKLPQKTFADWKAFEPTFERIEDEEIAARAKESQDTSGKTTEIFSSRITRNQLSEMLAGGIVLMGGWGQKAQESGYFDKREMGGAIGTLAQAMRTVYDNPPASGLAWLGDTLTNAGLIAKPAYAQGIGFAGLSPLLPLWKTARNISYSILIIIMVIIGFMVIFRTKIDPKTVISVQAALPKIILTLILITLSYPIAGFMIDLMYLSMAIAINMLATGLSGVVLPPGLESLTNTAQQQTEFITGGWGKLAISVFNVNMFIPLLIQGFGGSGANIGIWSVGSIITAIVGAIIQHGLAATAFAAGLGQGMAVGFAMFSLIILFILFLGLLFTLIRLTFLLINSYIQVIVTIILGPLFLLKEAIPGQSAFSEWMRNLIANLIVFPATVAVIYFSWIMTAIAWKGNLWGAPLTFMGGGTENGNPMAIFMGLGIIFLAPNLVASIKKVFQAKPVLPITAGTAFSPITGGVQTTMGAASQFYYMKQIIGGEHQPTGRGGLFSNLGNVVGGVFGRKSSG